MLIAGEEQGPWISRRDSVSNWERCGDCLEPGLLLVDPHVRLPRRKGPGGGPFSRPAAKEPLMWSRPIFHQSRPGFVTYLPLVCAYWWILKFLGWIRYDCVMHCAMCCRFWRIDRILSGRITWMSSAFCRTMCLHSLIRWVGGWIDVGCVTSWVVDGSVCGLCRWRLRSLRKNSGSRLRMCLVGYRRRRLRLRVWDKCTVPLWGRPGRTLLLRLCTSVKLLLFVFLVCRDDVTVIWRNKCCIWN